jgi:hypothetical protein
MTALVGRRWSLEVGRPGRRGIAVEQHRTTFSVRQKSGSRTTTADIAVWMPPPDLRTFLEARGAVVRLLAGYAEGGAVELARGEVVPRTLAEPWQRDDRVLSWTISGGRLATLDAVPSRSWSQVRASDVIEYVRRECGLAVDVIRLGRDFTFARGYVVEGSPRDELSQLCEATGSEWQIVDGRLRILPRGEPSRARADRWSADTGMMWASPDVDGAIRAMALLRPSLRPGDVVSIVDDAYSGEMVAREVSHYGDSDGDAWYTEIEGRPRG